MNNPQTNFEVLRTQLAAGWEAAPAQAIHGLVPADNWERIQEIKRALASGREMTVVEAHGLVDHTTLTFDHRKLIAAIFGLSVPELKQAWAAVAKNKRIAEALGRVPEHEYDWMGMMAKKYDLDMSFHKEYTLNTPYVYGEAAYAQEDLDDLAKRDRVVVETADPKNIGFAQLFAQLIKENAVQGLKYSNREIEHALNDWSYRKQNQLLGVIKAGILYNPRVVEKAEVMWDALVGALTTTNLAETKAVLKHTIWQVKRKLFALPVDFHLMAVLTGQQESGKTVFIRKLVSPVQELVANTNFTAITDDRDHDLWNHYVFILDEMGNSTQANIEAVKQRITGDTHTSRVMATNTNTVIKNRATWIGSSNKDLSLLIFDNTGMRRFFQITCKAPLGWDIINETDYEVLWQSIDEDAPSALLVDKAIKASIGKIQSQSRFRTDLEIFFDERKYLPKGQEEVILLDDLFKEYMEWSDQFDKSNNGKKSKFARDIIDIPHRIPGLKIEAAGRVAKGARYRIRMEV